MCHFWRRCVCWPGGGRARADTPFAPENSTEALTAEGVQSALKLVDESKELDETLKAKLRQSHQQALRELESAKTWAEKAARFQQMTAAAPDDLKQARRVLTAVPDRPAGSIPADLTLPQFEQAISKKEGELNQGRTALAELEAEPKRRATRRLEIPPALTAARDRLADAEKQWLASPPAGELATSTAARRILLRARRQAAAAEIAAYEREMAAYEAMAELLPVRRDLAARQVDLAEQELKQWREALNRRREHEADRQIQHAQLEARQVRPAVRDLAHENARLAELRKELAQKIADTTGPLEHAQQRLATLKAQFKRIQDKVDTVGGNNAIGLLLRKQREALPNVALHNRSINARQTEIRDGQLALLQFDERRSALANLDLQVHEVLASQDLAESESGRKEMEAATRELLRTEKDYLDGLIADYNSYFDKLVELDNAERQLIQETEACARYIDERVLWIDSAPVLGAADLRQACDAMCWFVRPDGWRELGHAVLADASNHPVPWLLMAAVVAPLARCRGRMRRRLVTIGEQTARASFSHFTPTLEAVLLSVGITAAMPVLLWFVAWRMSAEIDASEWCKAVGGGLAAVAKVQFLFGLLHQFCHAQGLGGAHFDWDPAGLKALRRQIRWFMLVCQPLAFVGAAMSLQENDRWRDSLGRICFMLAGILFSLFMQRALRPGGSLSDALLAARRGGWLDRLRYVWYPLVVFYPLVLSVAAGAGYFYTGQQLGRRIFTTAYLIVGFIFLRALLLRWTVVNRRKLSIEQARQRRAALADSSPGLETSSGLAAPTDPNRDLATINNQTRRLIEYSLALAGILAFWFIWVDVLPALRILDRVQLWQITVTATETVRGPDGAAVARTVERLGAVTLADLGLAVLVLATTLIAVRNLPGLLEMSLLQHLPLDAGVRYALSAVSRYVITMVGVVLACSSIGLGWSRVQWLLAAISVGLGFGLQEIFANFVSGLIILFERPIRVGDVITVDNVTGLVSRIRMRATTITNWDRKELIIPNKEFITGRVLNWTLSDQVNRVVITVGIAYGSDTARARELLLGVAKSHPVVLDDPPATVSLEEFGPSALKFVLRCFLPNLESRGEVIHDLHMAIERTLREAGVELAFPTHDVHVRSISVPSEVLQAMAGGPGPVKRHVA